jgi:histidine triad (HIT) family protein
MFNHAPPDYECPFCLVVAGVERDSLRTVQHDVVCRAPLATAFICSGWWPNNPGHVLIVPNAHFENLFELPPDYAAEIHGVAQRIGRAMLASYGCEGISTRQHNGPGAYQEVWHYHLHVFPRNHDDKLYELTSQRRTTTPDERAPYAERLRAVLAQDDASLML